MNTLLYNFILNDLDQDLWQPTMRLVFVFTPKELHAIGIRYLGFKIFGRPKMAEKPRSLSAFYINRQELGNKIGNIVFEPPKRFWLLGRVEPASRWVVRVPHRPAACLKLRTAAI
jgi:hypothetical protein